MGSCQKPGFLSYPIPEIPDDFENKSGTDRVLKKTSGRVSGTRWALTERSQKVDWTCGVIGTEVRKKGPS